MKSRPTKILLTLKLVGTLLIILGVTDAAEIFEKGTFIEKLLVPYIWIPGAILLIVSFALEHNDRKIQKKSKKEIEIELEAARRKPY